MILEVGDDGVRVEVVEVVFKEENEKIPKSPASFYKVFRDFLVTRIRFPLYHLYPDVRPRAGKCQADSREESGS